MRRCSWMRDDKKYIPKPITPIPCTNQSLFLKRDQMTKSSPKGVQAWETVLFRLKLIFIDQRSTSFDASCLAWNITQSNSTHDGVVSLVFTCQPRACKTDLRLHYRAHPPTAQLALPKRLIWRILAPGFFETLVLERYDLPWLRCP